MEVFACEVQAPYFMVCLCEPRFSPSSLIDH